MSHVLPLPLPRTSAPWLAGLGAFVLVGGVGALLGVRVKAPATVSVVLAVLTFGAGLRALVMVRRVHGAFNEIALIGTGLFTLSLCAVAGLVASGGLLRSSVAGTLATIIGFVLAMLFTVPLFVSDSRFARRHGREWRSWVGRIFCVIAVLVAALAVAAVMRPSVFAVEVPLSVRVPLCVVGFAGAARIAARLRHLSRLGGSVGCDTATFGWIALALAALCLIGRQPFSTGWWVAHSLVLSGVFFVVSGLQAVIRDLPAIEVFEPVISRDPLYALDLAMTPLVQEFCRDLDGDHADDCATGRAVTHRQPLDRGTDRDHVRRVAELAVRAGEVSGVSGSRLRDLGIAAILHDVGKRVVPPHILTKRARLHPDEYAQVQLHAAEGERLLLACPSLAAAAPIVRWHHERVDGRGYPDRLAGDSIPMEAMIVSVCDAFDAMVSDRSYRRALGVTRALEVLAEHSGSQWDADAVAAVESVVKRGRLPQSVGAAMAEPRGRPMPYIFLDGLPVHIDEAIAPRNPVVDSIADLIRAR